MGLEACIDTDVLIDLSRTSLIAFITKDLGLSITTITVYEYTRGMAFLGRDPAKVVDELRQRFSIIDLSIESIIKASQIYADLRKKGQLIPDPDILIASICITNNKPLSTKNTKHFNRLLAYGLKLIPPKQIAEAIIKRK